MSRSRYVWPGECHVHAGCGRHITRNPADAAPNSLAANTWSLISSVSSTSMTHHLEAEVPLTKRRVLENPDWSTAMPRR